MTVRFIALFFFVVSFSSIAFSDESRNSKSDICNHFKKETSSQYREIVEHETSKDIKGGMITHLKLTIENTKDLFDVYYLHACNHYFCGGELVYFPETSSQKNSFVDCQENLHCPSKEHVFDVRDPEFLATNVSSIWSDAKMLSGINGGRDTPRYTQAYPVSYDGEYYIYLIDSTQHHGKIANILVLRPQKAPELLCSYKGISENNTP